ncbi:MAG: hypothetical protein H2069_00140 [Legionella sp.]|nr:hypothetical protein [Legionella sp.]
MAFSKGFFSAKYHRLGLVLLLSLFSVFVLPILFFIDGGRGIDTSFYYDQANAHLLQINYFIENPLTVFNYAVKNTAMTPGYHLFVAHVSKMLGLHTIHDDTWIIRLLNLLFGYGSLALVWKIVYQQCQNKWQTLCLVFPLSASYYFLSAAIWISTDNPALFFYTLILYFFLQQKAPFYSIIGAMFCLVFIRHIYLPVIGVCFCHAWVAQSKQKALLFALLTALPVVILVGIYAYIWGGLTPPALQKHNAFVFLSPLLLLHFFALAGLLVLPYLPFFITEIKKWSSSDLAKNLLFALLVAGTLWLLSPSTYFDPNDGLGSAGRWGSMVWLIAKFTPFLSLGDKSLSVLLLAMIGAALLYAMVMRAMQQGYFPVEAAMLFFYVFGYACQVYAWQRYLEPVLLVTFAVFGGRLTKVSPYRLMIVITAYGFYAGASLLNFCELASL